MGLESYLLSGALNCIVSQKLIRKLCSHCKTQEKVNIEKLGKIQRFLTSKDTLYTSVGCEKCLNTGYKDRILLSEVLVIDQEIKKLISQNKYENLISKYVFENGFISMFEDAIRYLQNGDISLKDIQSNFNISFK
jgi:type II secretory ATPase GspE/PulE/Tfp pilus assembly ATPase PilB-like protein